MNQPPSPLKVLYHCFARLADPRSDQWRQRLNMATEDKVTQEHRIEESLMSDRVSINISAHIARVTLTRADK